ncbi:MAG: hypothetical protein R2911_10990 [Caldilineaceae bacterium]
MTASPSAPAAPGNGRKQKPGDCNRRSGHGTSVSGTALDEAGVRPKCCTTGIAKEQILAAVELRCGAAICSSNVEPILDPRTQKVVNLAAEERRILGHRQDWHRASVAGHRARPSVAPPPTSCDIWG